VDDLALAVALTAGDEDAFRTLVELETTSVFRTCYRILGRIEDAEDATQETFVLAHRSLASYRGDGRPGAWLARIATRHCWRRAAANRRQVAFTTPLDDVLVATLPGAGDPARDALDAERREGLRSLVAALPEPYREVITLRFFGELSLADICVVTDRPMGTVKAQVHRGLEQLRRALARGAA
jgi:RNA polymerase sigma-70 factor (ECF subfamily)